MKPTTLGELKQQGSPAGYRSVKDELRDNLIQKLSRGESLFPGIVGYQDSVVPGIVNALLARHNLILLGLRGQAKSRILRALTQFLDPEMPAVSGCEINDDPFFPICGTCKKRISEEGDDLPIVFLLPEQRYVEKLATPDVTIADIIGDLDPIKAAKHGRDLSAHENIHFGLLPRAHRGIFAMNELPDLAPKIQVGLFNIMQEGDVQIKGFPLRLPLDVLMVFSANPEDYTARGKIVTPLKDRIGSEVKTHYPDRIEDGIQITLQEAWIQREESNPTTVLEFISEVVEGIATEGRQNQHIDKRSGVSQRLPIACLESAVSNAERRALTAGEDKVVPRISDIYGAIPAITGKLELEYEGELKGAESVTTDLIRSSLLRTFKRYFPEEKFDQIVQWFDLGGEVKVHDQTPAAEYFREVKIIQGLEEILDGLGVSTRKDLPTAVSWVEFILEGLYAQKLLSRSEDRGYFKEVETQEEEGIGDSTRPKRSFN
ncbi:MAG: magnesium chelatase [Acidobacteriota bacterium]